LVSKQPAGAPAVDQSVQTILLIGSDRRWGEHGGRSDTMMLVRVDPKRHTISVLSIPRDLKVPIHGYGASKVNAAFAYGGDRLLISTLRDYFGVRIDHFIEVNFRGFRQVVNALGGVWISVDGRYFNRNVHTSETNFADIDLQPGYQKLNATDALTFVRFRHFDSDFVRAARQQLFLREAERQVFAAKYDYPMMSSLLHAFAKATVSDIDSLGTIWGLLDAVRATPGDRITRELVPGTGGLQAGTYYYESADAQRKAVIDRWYHPVWKVMAQNMTNTRLKRRGAASAHPTASTAAPSSVTAGLVSDGGRGRALLQSLHPSFPACAPTLIPRGYWWGSSSPMRSYKLQGQPAIAGWMTAGSGNSVLLMETTWTEAPVLANPTRSLRYAGRAYDIWYESGTIRQVAWRRGQSAIWLTNTLQNKLSATQMLSLSASCA
jgi:LCP family protein required for cell wall assembly